MGPCRKLSACVRADSCSRHSARDGQMRCKGLGFRVVEARISQGAQHRKVYLEVCEFLHSSRWEF